MRSGAVAGGGAVDCGALHSSAPLSGNDVPDRPRPRPMQRGAHPRTRSDDDYATGRRLREHGGILSGFASTWAGALDVDRSAVLDAVSGPTETFLVVDGRNGTTNPDGATNRIRSDDYPERTGVDRVYIAVTRAQFSDFKRAATSPDE